MGQKKEGAQAVERHVYDDVRKNQFRAAGVRCSGE